VALAFAPPLRRGGGLRYESPSMAITCAWCRRRSIAALASRASPKSAGHSSMARFNAERTIMRSWFAGRAVAAVS
jgi:hypothetical protein